MKGDSVETNVPGTVSKMVNSLYAEVSLNQLPAWEQYSFRNSENTDLSKVTDEFMSPIFLTF